jgi:putative copper export protein
MSGDALADVLLIASRLLWYAGCLGIIGASAFRLFVLPAAGRAAPELDRAAAATGLIAAAVLLAGVLARLYAQAYVSFGLEERITASLLLEVATGLPPWSTGWMLQLAAGVLSAAAYGVARRGRRVGWFAAYAGSAAVGASAPLTGHAVAQAQWYSLPITLQAAHVLGAGVWIGGLFVVLVVAVPRTGRRIVPGPPVLAALVNAFSPLAIAGAGLLAVTGASTAVLYLQAPADLWATWYGRTLLLKIAMFAGVAATGFVNWQYVRPRLMRSGGAEVLRRTVTIELTVAALVLAVTALLVGLPQPGE